MLIYVFVFSQMLCKYTTLLYIFRISLKKQNEEEININQQKSLEIFQNQINEERGINEELRNQIVFEKTQRNDFMKNLYSSVKIKK